jgi:phosphoglycolate phosphatase
MIYEIVQEPSFKYSYYIGDTLADGLSAQANNLPFIRANYGYGEKDEWSKVNIYKSINSIDELLASNIYE